MSSNSGWTGLCTLVRLPFSGPPGHVAQIAMLSFSGLFLWPVPGLLPIFHSWPF